MTNLWRYALSACIVIGFIRPAAARADSLPTFTATSASAAVGGGSISWSISGNGFSLGGFGGWAGVFVSGLPAGSNLGNNLGGWDPLGLASYYGGSPGSTAGSVTIDGISESVQLQTGPEINFSTARVTIPYGANADISLRATLTGSSVAQECLGPGLVPVGCGGAYGYYGFLPIANINIDVPGMLTFYGYNSDPADPAQGLVTIDAAKFTSLPEPVSGPLACVGLMLLAGAVKFRRKS